MPILARDIGTDIGTTGHSENIIASATHSWRRHEKVTTTTSLLLLLASGRPNISYTTVMDLRIYRLLADVHHKNPHICAVLPS